jgi:small basic protein (TIGR04137 family)
MRNVLKRHERLQYLISRGQWKPGEPVFGLPKIKQIKFKARKAAAKEAAPEAAAAGTAKPPASK